MKSNKFFLFVCFLICLFISGCTKDTKPAQPGKMESISLAQAQEKIKQKDTFVFVVTMNSCSHCANFKEFLDRYLPDHSIVIYDILLDNEPDISTAFDDAKKAFPDFYGTPGLYYVENGEFKGIFWNDYEELNEDQFHSWLIDYDCLSS